MAQATNMSLAQGNLADMSVDTEIDEGVLNENIQTDPISYWAALLRKNLPTACASVGADEPSEIDEKIMLAPRRKSSRDALAREIIDQLYPAPPDLLAPIIKYEKDMVMLRSMVLDLGRSAIAETTEINARFNWIERISRQGPWDENKDPLSLNGAPSLPMPVEQSSKKSLAPFFAHLAGNGTHDPITVRSNESNVAKRGVEPYHNTELLEFEKGALYADGRIDLCKMVTGPRNIGDLMESLESNGFSKHFLLGNNIVGPVGAKAIASFIGKYPDRIETWYLGGNCIDTASFGMLVDSMVKSTSITNVWLKRNPLGAAAAKDVFRLITQTPNLRTLDLDQTELGDNGVAELFDLLVNAKSATLPGLRHLYLNGCGVGEKSCNQIAHYLQSPNCSLESLYVSHNPIGRSVSTLATGLIPNTTLKRLVLQSCGLKDEGIIALADALKCHPSLSVLDIGQGYATEDLGMRFNWITDSSAAALSDLVQTSQLQYLDISYAPASQSALTKILEAVTVSKSLLWFHVKALVAGAKDAASVKAGQAYARMYQLARKRLHENVEELYKMDYVRFEYEHKRFLTSPTDVRFIDSIYRNRDSAAARRGLKRLDKWWDEHEETLQHVQDGSLV